jgi:diguanylate cyclase (GGDEF)-like protein
VSRYVAGVTVPGWLLLGVILVHELSGSVEWRVPELLVFSVFIVLGELRPIKIQRGSEQEEIVTSATFTFAVLLVSGLAAAVVVRTLVALLPALLGRKPWWKAAFNAAGYTVSLGAAGGVLALISELPRTGQPLFLISDLPLIGVGALVFFFVDNMVTGTALAFAHERRVVAYLRSDFAFQATTSAVMLALSPVVLVCAERSLWLVPLIALPMAAVHASTSVGLEKHQALHDALTNLPNRRLFRDRVEQALLAARRSKEPLGVMIIDLDRFKEVNDTLGHHVGDLVLQHVAVRLQSTLREGDTIARLGGDEFAILLPAVTGEGGAGHVADKLLRALEEPFLLTGWSFDVEASIGIAVYPAHGEDVDSLLQRADVAMYVAKEARTGHEVYSAERDRHSPRRLSLLGDLRKAVEAGQLVVHYQPKADMRAGGIIGVEALLRWHHPEHGLIPPDEFIPLAEHTGLIKPLTMFVLEEALSQCHAWRQDGLEVGVAVNLSMRNLYDPHFPDEVQRLLRSWRVEPRYLEFEITESVIMADPQRAGTVLGRLSALGVGLSLDDFGVGYSSLAYLRRLPVTEIKIDKSFVVNITNNESDAMIVRSTIGLARSLGLRVVAEGVESKQTWTRLVALGCDVAQGYYLCRPKAAHELTPWLHSLPTPPSLHPLFGEPPRSRPSVDEVCRRLSAAERIPAAPSTVAP